MGVRLDADFSTLVPGRVTVMESPRRLRKEQSYGFVHALWWIWLADGRSAVSVPPGAGIAVREIVKGVKSDQELPSPDLAERLRVPVDAALLSAAINSCSCCMSSSAHAIMVEPRSPMLIWLPSTL